MISKLIYEYFKLPTIGSYEKCKYKCNKIINNNSLLDDTLANFTFKNEWYKKLNKQITHNHFNFSIASTEKLTTIYRILINRNRVFSYTNAPRTLHKSNNENFVFIISKKNNKHFITHVAFKEENPALYSLLLNSKLEDLSLSRYTESLLWTMRLTNIDSLFNSYTLLKKSFSKNMRYIQSNSYEAYLKEDSSFIDVDKLINYARKYALNYNKHYNQFNNSGGDCTNFVSQALNFAGLPQSHDWKPYSASWIMVIPLRDYLIKNDISIEYNEICKNPIGTIIQFFSPVKERFSHTGIITNIMDDDELLYCCHDYDKLDFPLSETYPVFYQRIRNLKIK